MKLEPRSAPGSAKRKARAFAGEIQRLRGEGYTIEAIREALADVGLVVGWSTVQREAARPLRRKKVESAETPSAETTSSTITHKPEMPVTPAQRTRTPQERSGIVQQPVEAQVLGTGLSGKDFAAKFAQGQIGNSLARRRGRL